MADKTIRLEMSNSTFLELIQFLHTYDDLPYQLEQLKTLLDKKLDKIIEHDLYTTIKTAPTEEQKQEAYEKWRKRKFG